MSARYFTSQWADENKQTYNIKPFNIFLLLDTPAEWSARGQTTRTSENTVYQVNILFNRLIKLLMQEYGGKLGNKLFIYLPFAWVRLYLVVLARKNIFYRV